MSMKVRPARWLVSLCGMLGAVSSPLFAAPPADLDTFAARAMNAFDVPGMAVAIVESGQATVTKGYGVRKLGEPGRVDEHTIFSIASNTKAFTTTALAILVDEGKLSWDDKVVDRLPGFRMFDDYTTREMTLRDLLTHRSGLGLGAGDLMFWPETTFTRPQIVERLRFVRPATSFRSGYAYDNVLYVVAGSVIEALSGQSWESFIQQRIFAPLGMRDSVPSFKDVRTDNRGWPHTRTSGRIRGMGPVAPLARVASIDNEAPAGGIHSSASDMARWIRLQLDRGKLGEGRLFSEAVAKEMWTPQTLIPIEPAAPPLTLTTPGFNTYAFGWVIRDYRGHKIVMHEGLQEGAISATILVPDRHVGFIVMINSEDGEARWSLCYHLLDHYLKLPPTNWIGAYTAARAQTFAESLRTLDAAAAASPVASAEGPSLPLAQYARIYRDPWYGTVSVTANATGLQISFDHTPAMRGALEHVQGDTFRTRFVDRGVEDAYITFSLNSDHSVERATMRPISPLADFSFDYADLSLTPSSGN